MRVMEKKKGSGEGVKGGVFELWERSEERGVLGKGVPGVEEIWDCCEGPGQVRRATVSKWRFRESVVPRVDYTVLEQTDDWSSRVALLRWRSFCEKQNVQCKDKLCFEDQRHFMASLLDHIEANSGIDEVYFDEEPWGEQANSSDIRTYIRGFNLGTAAQVRSFIMKNTSALQQNALEIKPLQQPCHFDSPDSVLLVDCKGWNSTTIHCLMSVLGEVNRVSQTRQGVFYVRYSDTRILTWSKLLSKCLASEFFCSRKSLLTNSTADFLASSPMILIPNTRSANYELYFLHSNDKYFRKGEIKTSTIVSSSKNFKQTTNKKVERSIERQSSISSQSTAISYQTSVQPVKLDDLLSTSRFNRQLIVLDILSLRNSMPVINPLTTRAPVFTNIPSSPPLLSLLTLPTHNIPTLHPSTHPSTHHPPTTTPTPAPPSLSLMLRNIPNNLSTPTLFTLLSSLIDYLYLPIDFNNRCNLGYAFVNCVSERAVMKVEERFEGKEWSEILGGDKVGPERSGSGKSGKSARKSAKVARVCKASVQGRNNLIRLFKVGGVAEKLRQGTIDLAPQDICPIVVPNYSQDSFLF